VNHIIDITVFLFGGIIGSFLNVCIYRLPRSKSILFPPSSCPVCNRRIEWYDNVPLISYLFLKGRCRGCGNRIAVRYPLVESITAIFFLLLYKKYGLSLELPVQMLFLSLLIVISFVDLDFRIIPDVLSVGGVVAGFLLAFIRPIFTSLSALYGILLGGGILFAIAFLYQLITKREGMGGGDIKLLAMVGSFCGVQGVVFTLMSGSLVGTIVGLPLMFIKGEDTKYAIPFGPFLSLGALIYIFVGDQLISLYDGFLNLVSRG
jgi:leader peptidase (prepilin peptidase) / N-methyltransferase